MAANSKNLKSSNEKDVDVLYQKLGNTWYAFSIVEDEVFMSPVSEDTLNGIKDSNHEALYNDTGSAA
jgi:hypothetical protein